MTKTQVEGIEAKLAAFGSAASPLKHVAYGSQPHITRLAKMQPVTEIGCGHGKSYGKPGRHGGQVPYGCGYVQLM